ncbi:MAG: phage head-tail connector protein [Clostridiales bacterium]|nr:phage head-tail connector protein [Clostridiales bacterium]
MNMETLKLLKNRLGITSDVRNEYLNALIDAVKQELLQRQGILINEDDPANQMFLVDYCAYRYQNVNDLGGMPKHLHWRLRNLMVAKDDV